MAVPLTAPMRYNPSQPPKTAAVAQPVTAQQALRNLQTAMAPPTPPSAPYPFVTAGAASTQAPLLPPPPMAPPPPAATPPAATPGQPVAKTAAQKAADYWADLNAYDESLNPGQYTWVDQYKQALIDAFQLNPYWQKSSKSYFPELHHTWDTSQLAKDWGISADKGKAMNKSYADRFYNTLWSYFGGKPVYTSSDFDTADTLSKLASIKGWENVGTGSWKNFAKTAASGAGKTPGLYGDWWYM